MRIIGPTDKEEIHTHIQVEPKLDPTGRFSHWHLALFDVSEARLQNLRLKEVHEQLQLAAQAAELGVWNYDLASGAAKWNTHLYRLLGLEPREGTEDAERFSSSSIPKTVAAALQALRRSSTVQRITSRKSFASYERMEKSAGSRHAAAFTATRTADRHA